MSKIITMPYNNIQIENIINISERLSEIRTKIADNAYTSIYLDNNEFNFKSKILSASFYLKTKNDVYVECPICYESTLIHRSLSLNCNHSFCKKCYNNWNNRCNLLNYKTTCPLCRA
jgi:hypothetical protein